MVLDVEELAECVLDEVASLEVGVVVFWFSPWLALSEAAAREPES